MDRPSVGVGKPRSIILHGKLCSLKPALTRILIVSTVAAGLILTIAYCQRDSAPDAEPIPTTTPTPTPNGNRLPTPAPTIPAGSPPTPTATRVPLTAAQAMAAALDAFDQMDAYRFAFTLTGPDRVAAEGTGTWVAPNDYQLAVSQALCPPPVPGGTVPIDCEKVLVYDAYRIDDRTFNNLFGRGWEEGSHAAQFELPHLDTQGSPARMALALLGTTGDLSIEHTVMDGIRVLRLVGTEGAHRLSLDPETFWPVHASMEIGADRWEWWFTSRDAPLAVEPALP